MNNLIELLNRYGSIFTGFALPMLIQSTALILIIAVLEYYFKNRVRAIVRHGIWLLVLVKLVLPTSLSSPTGLIYWLPGPLAPGHFGVVEGPSKSGIIPVNSTATVSSGNRIPEVEAVPSPPEGPSKSAGVSAPASLSPLFHDHPHTSMSAVGIVFCGWIAGVLALSGFAIHQTMRMRRTVRCSTSAPPAVQQLLRRCGCELELGRLIDVRVSGDPVSPVLCGLFRPVIVLPEVLARQFDETMLRSVLLHELAHFKRRDLWVHGFQTFLQIFYFYNPVLWFANFWIGKVREQAVDETVLVALKKDAVVYPETLLKMARLAFAQPKPSFCMVGIMEPKSALGGRIKRMLETPLPSHSRFGWIGLSLILALGVVILPMSRAQRDYKEPKSANVTNTPTKSTNEFQKWVEDYTFNMYGETELRIVKRFKQSGLDGVNFLKKLLVTVPGDGGRAEVEKRRKAAFLLKQLGPLAKPAIPELIKSLDDDEPVQMYAAMALAGFGTEASAAVKPLIESLYGGNGQAALALTKIAPESPEIMTALIQVMEEKNRPESMGQLRTQTAKALGNLGPEAGAAIPALRAALDEGNDLLKMFAAQSLRRIAPDSPEILAEAEKALKVRIPARDDLPLLVEKLRSPDLNRRLEGLAGLSVMGPEAGTAWADVAALESDHEMIIREGALRLIGSMNVEKEKTLALLLKHLNGSEPTLECAAASGLAEMGTNAASALPDLLKALQKPEDSCTMNILAAFCRPGLRDTNAIPEFRHLLKSLNTGVRNNAAGALGFLGDSAKEAIVDLKPLLQDDDFMVRRAAALALWRIDKVKPSTSELLEMLSEDDYGQRYCLPIVEAMGTEAAGAASAVKPLLRHWDPKIREQAKAAWQSMFPAGDFPPEVPRRIPATISMPSENKIPPQFAHLIHKLDSSSLDVRLESAAALGKMGSTAFDAIPFLLPMLKDGNPEVRSYIAATLGEIDPKGKQVVLPLAELLRDANAEVRQNALASLKKVGGSAREAMPALQIASNDENARVRMVAREILNTLTVIR